MSPLHSLDRLATLDTILVGIVWRSSFKWFCSEKEDWVLDQTAWGRHFGEEDSECYHRHGICILSQETIDEFMSSHRPHQRQTDELRDWFRGLLPLDQMEESIHLFPTLLIDFDQRALATIWGEYPLFERFLPPGWTAATTFTPPLIPQGHQYWQVEGVNWWKRLSEAGNSV